MLSSRKKILILCGVLIQIGFLPEMLWAQSRSNTESLSKKKAKTQKTKKSKKLKPDIGPLIDAVVSADGTTIYDQPTFDAPSVAYLNAGDRLKVGTKQGAFYPLIAKDLRILYVPDHLVQVDGQKVLGVEAKSQEDIESSTVSGQSKKYFGLSFAMGTYADAVERIEGSAEQSLIGARYSMPAKYFSFPFTYDFNFLYTLSTPKIYDEMSLKATTGSVMFFNADLVYPFWRKNAWKMQAYLGSGIFINYVSIDNVVQRNASNNLISVPIEEARVGGDVLLGVSFRISKMIYKAEYKYFLDKKNYYQLVNSLMMEF